MRAILVLLVFLVDAALIVSILGKPVRAGRKLAWCAAVVLVPLVGAAAWLLVGRSRS